MKRLSLIALPVLALLFAAAAWAWAWQDPSHGIGIQEDTAYRQAGFAQSPDNPVEEGTGSRTRSSADVPPVRTGASVEERLEAIRGSLRSYGTEENGESLPEEGNGRQDSVIPLVFNDAVEYYINYFTTTKREMFKRWLERKRRYAPLVKEVLRDHGLPEDLVYLAMIESGFNLLAYSPMKAAGPWQFIPETGKRYGLEINHWVDERRDIRKSTVAAARYLEELFDQFGCWYLAAAGYNAGENRIDRLIRRHGTKDFWELRAYNTLPRETREYVPQLIAAAVIAKDPERYGLGEIEEPPAFAFVKETVPGGVPLKMVAHAASVDLPTIRRFNPEIKTGITPPGKEYRIRLPARTDRVVFQSSLSSVMKEGKRVVGVVRHVAKRRDNLSKITKRYGVSRQDLALVNASPLALKIGTVVYVPRLDGADEEGEAVLVRTVEPTRSPGRKFVRSKGATGRTASYTVRKANTLSGMTAKNSKDNKTHAQVKGSKKGRIESGKPSIAKHATKRPLGKAQKKYHVVKRGESFSGIAMKYGKTTESLRKLNKLKGDRVYRGTKLRVL